MAAYDPLTFGGSGLGREDGCVNASQFGRRTYTVGDWGRPQAKLPNGRAHAGWWGSRGRCLRRPFDETRPTGFVTESRLRQLLLACGAPWEQWSAPVRAGGCTTRPRPSRRAGDVCPVGSCCMSGRCTTPCTTLHSATWSRRSRRTTRCSGSTTPASTAAGAATDVGGTGRDCTGRDGTTPQGGDLWRRGGRDGARPCADAPFAPLPPPLAPTPAAPCVPAGTRGRRSAGATAAAAAAAARRRAAPRRRAGRAAPQYREVRGESRRKRYICRAGREQYRL